MTDPNNPTPEEAVALLALRKEQARQKFLKPLPTWPLAVSFFFALLSQNVGWVPISSDPQWHFQITLIERGAFFIFATLMYIHISALTEKVKGLTELLAKD